jgi:hypothetical protein
MFSAMSRKLLEDGTVLDIQDRVSMPLWIPEITACQKVQENSLDKNKPVIEASCGK